LRYSKQGLIAAVAATSAFALVGCSDSSGGTDEQAAAGYGDCQVYGEEGSISLTPVTEGVLTVQTNLPSPGWWKGTSPESIDGGYEYCLAANIAHRAGLDEVRVQNVSFDALVAGQTKDYDIAMAQISVTPERKEVVTFSAPYFDSNIGVLAPADSDITADNIASKTVGVQVGTTAVVWADETLKPKVAAKPFQDTTTLVTAVQSGLTDAAVMDTAIILGFAKNSDGALKVVGQFETGEKYAAIYPKGSSGAAAMDEAITAMKEDGTLDKLSKTWLGPELGGDPAAVPVWTVG
jgi:polar amino acid transport system substrate-binding protein